MRVLVDPDQFKGALTGALGQQVRAQWCLPEATGRDSAALDGGGAAGGTAVGLHAAVGARFEAGIVGGGKVDRPGRTVALGGTG